MITSMYVSVTIFFFYFFSFYPILVRIALIKEGKRPFFKIYFFSKPAAFFRKLDAKYGVSSRRGHWTSRVRFACQGHKKCKEI